MEPMGLCCLTCSFSFPIIALPKQKEMTKVDKLDVSHHPLSSNVRMMNQKSATDNSS